MGLSSFLRRTWELITLSFSYPLYCSYDIKNRPILYYKHLDISPCAWDPYLVNTNRRYQLFCRELAKNERKRRVLIHVYVTMFFASTLRWLALQTQPNSIPLIIYLWAVKDSISMRNHGLRGIIKTYGYPPQAWE
jgi:hypothetical protein